MTLQAALKVLIGISLLALPLLGGLLGFVVTAIHDPEQKRPTSWAIRSVLAALAAPAVHPGSSGPRPQPFLVSLLGWTKGYPVSGMEVLSGMVAATIIAGVAWGWASRASAGQPRPVDPPTNPTTDQSTN